MESIEQASKKRRVNEHELKIENKRIGVDQIRALEVLSKRNKDLEDAKIASK
jgi:hypothetical protein